MNKFWYLARYYTGLSFVLFFVYIFCGVLLGFAKVVNFCQNIYGKYIA